MNMLLVGAICGAVAVALILDFIIIGGADPRKWKGGGRKK